MLGCFRRRKDNSAVSNITIDDQKLDDYIGQRIQQSLETQSQHLLDQLNTTLNSTGQTLSNELSDHADGVKKDTEDFARKQIMAIENKFNAEIVEWRTNYQKMADKNRELLEQLKSVDDNKSHISINTLKDYLEKSGSLEAGKFLDQEHSEAAKAHQLLCYNLLQTLAGSLSNISIPILGHKLTAKIQPWPEYENDDNLVAASSSLTHDDILALAILDE